MTAILSTARCGTLKPPARAGGLRIQGRPVFYRGRDGPTARSPLAVARGFYWEAMRGNVASARGCPCHIVGVVCKRSQDGEAQQTPSERRACPLAPGFARRPQAEADAGTAAPARKQQARSERPAMWHGQPRASTTHAESDCGRGSPCRRSSGSHSASASSSSAAAVAEGPPSASSP